MLMKKIARLKPMYLKRFPLGRPQSVEDMGQAAVYLASAKNITGIALSVSGGIEMN
jgi:enoyl-[acyl-carrier-protein] reductase (NADH)